MDTYGADALRWWLLRDPAPVGTPDYTDERLVACYNRDLANTLGNLASRAPAMVAKYRDGLLPEATAYAEAEVALQALLADTVATADEAILRLDFAGGIGAVKAFVDAGNLYVTEQAPWVLAKIRRLSPGRNQPQVTRPLPLLIRAWPLPSAFIT